MPMPNITDLLNNTKELETVPEAKYKLEVLACREQRTQADDRDMYVFTIGIKNPPKGTENAAPMMEFFPMPNDEDEPDRAANSVRRLRRALECLGINFLNGFNVENAIGATGEAPVNLRKDNDGETRNHVVWPKYANEGGGQRDGRRR